MTPFSPDFPLGNSLEVFVRRADAERFIADDEPEIEMQLAAAVRHGQSGPCCKARFGSRDLSP